MNTEYTISSLKFATFDNSKLAFTLSGEGMTPENFIISVDGSDEPVPGLAADLLGQAPAAYITPYSISDAKYTGSLKNKVSCVVHGGKTGSRPAIIDVNGSGSELELIELLSGVTIEDFVPPKNAYFINEEETLANCEFIHPVHGWIPTTVAMDGSDDRPDLVYEVSVLSIAPYAAPVVSVEELEADAKALRDEIINSDISVLGVEWQIDKVSRDLMSEVIESAFRRGLMTETRNWILANNDPRATTAEDLQKVKDAYVDRLDITFTAYGTWRAGDKSAPFDV